MGNRTVILTTTGVAAIMLVIGMALGSFTFPMTKTETTTQLTGGTTTVTQMSVVSQTSVSTAVSTVTVSISNMVAVSGQLDQWNQTTDYPLFPTDLSLRRKHRLRLLCGRVQRDKPNDRSRRLE